MKGICSWKISFLLSFPSLLFLHSLLQRQEGLTDPGQRRHIQQLVMGLQHRLRNGQWQPSHHDHHQQQGAFYVKFFVLLPWRRNRIYVVLYPKRHFAFASGNEHSSWISPETSYDHQWTCKLLVIFRSRIHWLDSGSGFQIRYVTPALVAVVGSYTSAPLLVRKDHFASSVLPLACVVLAVGFSSV